MLLDTPLERFHSRPELLRDFINRLASYLRRHSGADLAEVAAEIQIEALEPNGAEQTLLKWWNASMSWAHCDEQRINGTHQRMVHPGTDRLRHDFVKQMGAEFHVRKVS